MNIVLTGGGTGGHVYPALSVAAAVRSAAPDTALLYAGLAGGAEERLVRSHGLVFVPVHSGQVRGKSPRQVLGSLAQLARGIYEAKEALATHRADHVFATGGYASMPVVLAAAVTRTPVTVFLPDVYPGWAVRCAALVATRVATSSDGALQHLPRAKTAVTGYPLRPEFWQANRVAGRSMLGLGEGPILLISGASSGSRTLNDAVLGGLPTLLERCEIVHLTGVADYGRVSAARGEVPERLRSRYHVFDYLDTIAWAMAAADLAVMRAGASCLAEPAAVGLPTILVPGSFSDQHRNAGYMASRGAALVLEEAALTSLPRAVNELLSSQQRLDQMSAAVRAMARPAAAQDLAELLLYGRVADKSGRVADKAQEARLP